ncbi:sulfite exporter TauE/SafE family protein [Thermosulfurimonas marina]|uniref:Probable membrane transporter protein n=1 Tax=Thermosulfurimonas marina TaxID=2047767 RepID=A0A6H1WTF5_9BACT|nr:TSUP family transporter [Thermosulfurimonas marina]QJA06472.1 sulfite exporter TauE/SafE family protein [Thermosulfurimonas marina]
MDFLKVTFPVSGVTTWVFLPPLVGFTLAFFGVMGGVTGAFLLLPFQFSVLGYTTPGVSATNLLYNLFTIPPALWRYRRQGRFPRTLTLAMLLTLIPGMFAGYLLRISLLSSPGRFRYLVGLVLLYLSLRLLGDLRRQTRPRPAKGDTLSEGVFSLREIRLFFGGEVYRVPGPPLLLLSLLVGLVGGAYGIGGGAILSPFLVAVLRLPIYITAGGTLATTFVGSLAGVLFYSFGPGAGPQTRPDLLLAALLGLGGLIGGWFGARLQPRIPERLIKAGLFLATLLVALKYLLWHK